MSEFMIILQNEKRNFYSRGELHSPVSRMGELHSPILSNCIRPYYRIAFALTI